MSLLLLILKDLMLGSDEGSWNFEFCFLRGVLTSSLEATFRAALEGNRCYSFSVGVYTVLSLRNLLD
jgi:hypothetical protein